MNLSGEKRSLPVQEKKRPNLTSTSIQKKTIAHYRLEREKQAASGLAVIRSFRPSKLPKQVQATKARKKSESLQEKLNKERLKEIHFKNTSRNLSIIFFSLLLLFQNLAILYIVYLALESNKLKDLQLIFAGLVAATLTETYFIAKKIIDFVFSNTDYTSIKKTT